MTYLKAIRQVMDAVVEEDRADAERSRRARGQQHSSYQLYLWDEAQKRQLIRLLSRYLPDILNDEEIKGLAWLLPPPELLAHPEDASWRSPFTIVASVVDKTLAAPIEHQYTLLELCQHYRPNDFSPRRTNWLYREPFSDLVPTERLYEMWQQIDAGAAQGIRQANRDKLTALFLIVRRLEQDLAPSLQRSAAPLLVEHSPKGGSLPLQSELWHEFTRLNSALDDLESHTTRAMPPHEREARFKSAILTRRLEGAERELALKTMAQATGTKVPSSGRAVVYQLSEKSVDFNARANDLGYALTPSSDPRLLYKNTAQLRETYPQLNIPPWNAKGTVADAHLTEFSILNIDRTNKTIALEPHFQNRVADMESAGVADFQSGAVLDRVHTDFTTSKIELTLRGIGYPASASDDPRIRRALDTVRKPAAPTGPETAASQFLWCANDLAATVKSLPDMDDRDCLTSVAVALNQSQWEAWHHSLSHRLSVIWGPPGTGKTTTLAAITAGALLQAHGRTKGIKVLLTAGTYNAVDTLLGEIAPLLQKALPEGNYRLLRLHSRYRDPSPAIANNIEQVAVDHWDTPLAMEGIIQSLEDTSGLVIVASVPDQIHNLAAPGSRAPAEDTVRSWFDLIIIDEASQMDVPHASLPISKGKPDCTFILAGDELQLPPIHQADPPVGLEYTVGSVYQYMCRHHGVTPQPLQVNYRANATLVAFTKKAGYHSGLTSHNPDLKLRFASGAIPAEKPEDWPDFLRWSDDLPLLLSPDEPAACFIYDDPTASQANPFEADTVASLIRLLYPSLTRQLANERDGQGNYRPETDETNDSPTFWQKAVGVVAPHRAQISAITSGLLRAFLVGHNPSDIRGAVDTVERFQGQQRDVIIASFGVGDPDTIADEDEFLYSLNRFNVMASRARAKLIVLTTRNLLDHLSRDRRVVEQSSLVKSFAESFCHSPREVTIGDRQGILRTADSWGVKQLS